MPHHQIKKQAQALPATCGHTGDLIPPVCALRLSTEHASAFVILDKKDANDLMKKMLIL